MLDPAALAATLVGRQAAALRTAGARYGLGLREIPIADLAPAVFAAAGFGEAVFGAVVAQHAIEAEPVIATLVDGVAREPDDPSCRLPCMHNGDGSAGWNTAAAFHADIAGVMHVRLRNNCWGVG